MGEPHAHLARFLECCSTGWFSCWLLVPERQVSSVEAIFVRASYNHELPPRPVNSKLCKRLQNQSIHVGLPFEMCCISCNAAIVQVVTMCIGKMLLRQKNFALPWWCRDVACLHSTGLQPLIAEADKKYSTSRWRMVSSWNSGSLASPCQFLATDSPMMDHLFQNCIFFARKFEKDAVVADLKTTVKNYIMQNKVLL